MTPIEILRSILVIPSGFFVIGCMLILQDSSRINGYIIMIGSFIWFFTYHYVLKYYRERSKIETYNRLSSINHKKRFS